MGLMFSEGRGHSQVFREFLTLVVPAPIISTSRRFCCRAFEPCAVNWPVAIPYGDRLMGVFERYLTLWVSLCIVAGVVLGNLASDVFVVIAGFEYAHVNLVVATFWMGS